MNILPAKTAFRSLPTAFNALAAFVMAIAVSGCGGGATSSTQGQVRLVNATSEFATMDLYNGSTLISSGVASYGAGGYADVDPGTITFNLKPGGSSATSATLSADVSKKNHYTVLAYTTGGTLTTSYLSEDEGAPSSGTAKLRIFNTASSDVGSVDVYLVTSACSALPSSASAATTSAVSGLQSGYTQVSAAGGGTTYHVCVTAAGDKTDLRLDIPAASFSDQQVVTLVLVRSAGGALMNGVLVQQQGNATVALNTSARIRLAVGASAGAAVTASLNGTSLGTNLTAPAVGGYKLVTAGALSAAITVGGTAANAAGLTAPAGADLTLLVAGTAASRPVLIADNNAVSTSTTKPVKLRLVNGMNGVSGTAILTDDYSNVGDGAAFGTASSYAQVASSAALGRLEVTYGGTQLCLSQAVTLNSGSVYTVFLLGDIPTGVGACSLRVDR